MWRRRRAADRQTVPVEPVDVSGATPLVGTTATPDEFPSTLDSAYSRSSGRTERSNADGEQTDVTVARRLDDDELDQEANIRRRQRSIPWVIVGLAALLLVGLFAWTVSRDSEPNSVLPRLPKNSELRFSFAAEGVAREYVSVFGSAEQPYVTLAGANADQTGTLYALDSIGNVRWNAGVGYGLGPRGAFLDQDRLLVSMIGQARSGAELTITLTMIDRRDGTVRWQVEVPGDRTRLFDGHVAVLQQIVSDDITSDDFERPASEVRVLDLDTGKITAERRFDHVPGNGNWFDQYQRGPFLVQSDDAAFVVDATLDAVSTPIPVADAAAVATDGNSVLVVDDEAATVYDLDGTILRSAALEATLNDATAGEWTAAMQATSSDEVSNRVWIYNGTGVDARCGAYEITDHLVELWSRASCWAMPAPATDSVEPYVLVVNIPNSSTEPGELVGTVDLATIVAEGTRARLGADGVVVETDQQLVALGLGKDDPRFEIDLGDQTRWTLLDGGIAVIEAASRDAATVRIYS